MANVKDVTKNPSTVGYEFPAVAVDVTKDMIRRYAESSFDFNPLHLDDDWMKDAQFGKTSFNSIIGHGLMTYSFVTRMMTDVLFPAGGWHERCEMRFKAPVLPGDTITASGTVTHTRDEDGYVIYAADVQATKQDGTVVAIGTAMGRMPQDGASKSVQAER